MRRARLLAVLAVAGAFALAPPAAASGQAPCGPVETTPDEGHLHLLGDAPPPVDYRTTPPASGWHYRERGRVRLGVQPPGSPLSEAEQVSVLAVGGVVISYRDLDPGDVAALEDLVAATGRPVALTPYDALEPGAVALTAWRTLQRCDGVAEDAVTAFVDAHAAEEPDFTMAGGEAEDGQAHDHAAAAGDAAAAAGGAEPERVPRAVVTVAAAGALALLAVAGWRALAWHHPGRDRQRTGRNEAP